MCQYEMVFMVSPEVDEEGVSGIIDRLGKSITDRGGVVDEMDEWGKRRLAYPVNKFMEANYVLTRFQLEPKLVREMERDLRSAEEVLRHLVIRVGN